jgi:NodT family efflux transporter outer membrane factor (OMF) lipoprotein
MVGPDYVRPTAPTGDAYKEVGDWKPAQPSDDTERGEWWKIFGDAELDALEQQIEVSNQNVAAARAQYLQARTLVQQARSAFWPTVDVDASVTRAKQSDTLGARPVPRGAYTTYTVPINIAWEIDLWGGFRRGYESTQASAQASAADVETTLLASRSDLAQNYFQLRTLDAQKQLLEKTAVAYERSLQLTRNRYANGVASRADVAQAETQLRTTQAQATDVGVQRAQLEHAIAVLIGKPPSQLALAAKPLTGEPPLTPVGLPSALLERRPDVAAAERRMAAANAQIGVATAAYYPQLSLGLQGGFASADWTNLATSPSRIWSIGPTLAQNIFDAGLRRAKTAQARAAYEGTIATYRQTVLTGLQEVEDNLAALRILEQEAQTQALAVATAEQSVTLTNNQYKAGVVSYLDVVIAQSIALSNAITAVNIQGRRMVAAVLLVKALGGGWSADQLPDAQELAKRPPDPIADAAQSEAAGASQQ